MSLPLSQKINKLTSVLVFLTLLVLPFQFGKHFWPPFTYVLGQRVDYLSPTVYTSDIAIFLLFLLHAKPFLTQVSKFFWIVLLLLSFGIFLSQSPLVGWYGLVKFVELIFFGWLVATNTQELFLLLFWSFGIGVLLESFLGVLQVSHQGSLNGLWYFLGERTFSASTPGIANATIHGQLFLRPYATFSHPNVFAGYLVVAALFFLATVLFTNGRMYKLGAFILLGFATGMLALTLGRVAIVVWFILTIVAVLTKLKKRFWATIGSILLLGLLLLLIDPVLSGRFFDATAYSESINLRLLLQQATLRMVASHTVLGVGLNNFLVVLPSFIQGHTLFGFLQPVHNIYLLVFSETGIVGLVIFLMFLGTAFVSGLSQWQQTRSLVSFFALFAFLAVVFIGVTDHYFLTLQQGQLLCALVLGLCFGHGTIPVWRFIKNLLHTRSTKS